MARFAKIIDLIDLISAMRANPTGVIEMHLAYFQCIECFPAAFGGIGVRRIGASEELWLPAYVLLPAALPPMSYIIPLQPSKQ